jgi:hypothetical protein
MNANGNHRPVNRTKGKQKRTPLQFERPNLGKMTLPQKFDEIIQDNNPRIEELLESIREKDLKQISVHNFSRYIRIFSICHKKKDIIPNTWECYQKKMVSILSAIDYTFFSDRNVNNLLQKFADEKAIVSVIKKRLKETKRPASETATN